MKSWPSTAGWRPFCCIGFSPTPQEDFGAKDPYVRPVLRMEMEDGIGAGEAPECVWVDAWKGRLVALVGGRWLGWCEGDERLLALVCHLAALRPVLDRGQLDELRSAVTASHNPLVGIDFPHRKVRLVTRTPQPDLLLVEHGDGTTAQLSFRYPAEAEITTAGSSGEEWVILRPDHPFEGRVARALRSLFTLGDTRIRLENRPWEDPILWRFSSGMGDFLAVYGEELLARGIGLSIGDPTRRLARAGARLQVHVSSGIDWFDLSVSAGEDLDLSRVNPHDPLFARGFVRTGEKIVYIGAEEAEKLRRIISLLDPSQRAPRVSRHDLEGAALLQEIAPVNPPIELRRASEISRALSAPRAFAGALPPRGFAGTLRDYQRAGYGWLSFLAENGLNGCLADDMGLGKTVQALAVVLGLVEGASTGTKGPGAGRAGGGGKARRGRSWPASWSRLSPRCRTGRRRLPGSPRPCGRSCTTASIGSATRKPSTPRTS